MKITNVRDPQFASEDTQNIYCLVTVEDHPHPMFRDGPHEFPFNATPHDCEEHGRQIYARALAGEFGPIAPFVSK